MANQHKGEVAFKAGEESYTLSYSANAYCELEDALGMDVNGIIQMVGASATVKLSTLRIIFWKGLEDHHEGISFDEAKRILKKLNAADMGTLMGKAIVLSMPKVDESSGPTANANPPTPGSQSGTGPASTESGQASDANPTTSGNEPPASST